MSFAALLIHTVTIYTPGVEVDSAGPLTDRYGNPVESDGEGAPSPARVELQGADEDQDGRRDTRRTMFRVFLPAGTAVSSLSKIAYDGHMHAVHGTPARLFDAAAEHHVELTMERLEG